MDSAGTGAWHVGLAAGRAVAPRRRGGGGSRWRARRAGHARPTSTHYDLLVAMDRSNRRDLLALAPRRGRRGAKVRLLLDDADVPDPYYGGPSGFDDVARPRPRGLRAAARRDRRWTSRSLTRGAVGGGDINEAYAVTLPDGRPAFVKTRPDALPGEYATEAAGLRWLGATGAVARARRSSTPPTRHLVLEWIDDGPTRPRGAGARRSRRCTQRARRPSARCRPDAPGPLRIGAARARPDGERDDWPTFYAEQRLAPLLPRAGLTARRPSRGRGGLRADRRPRRAARAAGPAARRPVERQRPRRPPDRSRRLRRAPRGRPGDAAAVRLAGRRASWPPTRRSRRSPPATRTASRSTSCCRCSSTPFCSAAATPASAERAARRYAG